MTLARQLLRQTSAIGWLTFQELLREKVLWSSFLFAFVSIGLAYSVSQLSFTDNARIALDFGLASVSVVGNLISIIMGSNLIAREVQNRTLYLVLTKPVARWQFVIGRVAGLMGIIGLNAVLMIAVVMGVIATVGGSLNPDFFKSLLLQLIEFGVLASLACIFSAFSTATMAAIMTSGFWVIGHAMGDVRVLSRKIEPAFMQPVLDLVSRVLPDLTRFDVKAEISHQLPVLWSYTASSALYGLAYIVFALVVACVVFHGRDL